MRIPLKVMLNDADFFMKVQLSTSDRKMNNDSAEVSNVSKTMEGKSKREPLIN